MWGGGGVKNDAPFFASKVMNLLLLFDFEPENCVVPDSVRFVWGGVGHALLQFMHFSAVVATLAILTASVTLWYQRLGV